MEAECTSPEGAGIILDASGSTDQDSTPGTNDDIAMFEWFEGEDFLGTGMTRRIDFSLGPHLVTLKVTDTLGEVDTDEVMVAVVDTAPPEISLSLATTLLWPPNHRMVDIEVSVSGSDICSPSAVVLEAVTSDEPDDAVGMGDGKTRNDIQGADTGAADSLFQLRAERSGSGVGRTYTVTYSATDSSANSATSTAHAFVPHDQDGIVDPISITVEESAVGTVVAWSDVEGASHYNLIRGALEEMVETGNSLNLGTVVCLQAGSTVNDSTGFEDAATPLQGQVFFYLVEYFDGWNNSYGSAAAPKPRLPGAGACD